ncbi:MAG: hypothetical protein LBQ58_11740, partial [Synergistaceae bacterium]|nr:hypothetical protein [Synergistaceae bacterium]
MSDIAKIEMAAIERFEDSVKRVQEHNDQFLARLEEKMDYHSTVWQERMDHHSERLDIKIGHIEEFVTAIKQSAEDVKKSGGEATNWNIALFVTVFLGIVVLAMIMLYSNSQIVLAIV